MSRHLEMLDYTRTAMVRKHYPPKVINMVTLIYLQGLKDEARLKSQLIRQKRRADAVQVLRPDLG